MAACPPSHGNEKWHCKKHAKHHQGDGIDAMPIRKFDNDGFAAECD
jgi:hypothetical protein